MEELGVGLWVVDVFAGGVFLDELGVFFVGEVIGGDVIWAEGDGGF